MSGLIILPILIVYILFAIFMYKLTASKIVLIVILVFPVWDIIIQKGIKTYYQVFESEPTVYALPEFDEDGKIESLGLVDVDYTSSIEDYLTEASFQRFKNKITKGKGLLSKIKKSYETTVYEKKDSFSEKLIRIHLNESSSKIFEFIKHQTSRYQIVYSESTNHFFELYSKRYYSLIDIEAKNKILVEAVGIRFSSKYAFFRREILAWQTGTGSNIVYISAFDNLNKLIKKVFDVDVNLNTNKGWGNE